jgi:5-formyltetrahydrofolate cyclo-ligase
MMGAFQDPKRVYSKQVNVSHEDKKTLRQKFLTLLTQQKEQDRLVKSRLIQKKLLARPEFVKARTILFYASFGGEVVTFEMIKEATQLNKKIALPVIVKDRTEIIPTLVEHPDRLTDGLYGIKQPNLSNQTAVDPKNLELVVVPGLAFDRAHNRLGRGVGYYDRFLAELSKEIPTLGLAFDFQMVDRLPLEAHDVSLTDVLVN